MTATTADDPQAASIGCGCASGSPAPSDRELKLERLVMDLEKRLRRLETAR